MILLKKIVIALVAGYSVLCVLLYLSQERLLFFPTKLSKDHRFTFRQPIEEVNIPTPDGKSLNNILFSTTAPTAKGVVVFFHGNGGCIDDWGYTAPLFLEQGYDVLYADYRGYGKSTGAITSEKQLINDAQLVYNTVIENYNEKEVILFGVSIGTGIATQLAANNSPNKLILISPYSSLQQLILEKIPVLPPFLIKYKLNTSLHLTRVNCPISIYHGIEDTLIPIHHAQELKTKYKKIDFTQIPNCGHNDIMRKLNGEELLDPND